MMKKKVNKKEVKKIDPKVSPYNFDTTKTYLIPMTSAENRGKDVEVLPVECNIEVKGRAVYVTTPGYTHYIFADYNFDWYLYTGYIKIKE